MNEYFDNNVNGSAVIHASKFGTPNLGHSDINNDSKDALRRDHQEFFEVNKYNYINDSEPGSIRQQVQAAFHEQEIEIWNELYDFAKSNVNHTQVSNYMTIGFVSSAVRSKTGKIYTGVCVDACCGLGICAERNALTTMLASGDFQVDRILTVDEDFNICPPCGACREFLAQMTPEKDVKIAIAGNKEDGFTTVSLEKLIPNAWT